MELKKLSDVSTIFTPIVTTVVATCVPRLEEEISTESFSLLVCSLVNFPFLQSVTNSPREFKCLLALSLTIT